MADIICENTDSEHYDDRLQQIKIMVGSTNKALVELDKNLKFIKENEELLKQHETKISSTDYIPLDHSRHREFVETVTMLVDFVKDWDHHKATYEAQSFPQLKAALQQVEAAITRNGQDFNELEDQISELQSYYESINHMCHETDNISSL